MLKTDELHDPNSCLNKAGLNEPLFVLRAQDLLAPDTVEAWAGHLETAAFGISHPDIVLRMKEKARQARQLADQMRRWNGPKKLPD